ncbi:MAG TPA: DMT family transporter [Gaiellaceae bacterium]
MQRAGRLPPSEGLALAAALVTVVLWASAFVGIRSAGRFLSPEALALGRLLVSSAVLGSLAFVRREALPVRGDLGRIALYGLLWLGVYNVVLNEAERRVDAGTAAMLVNVGPILIALLAGVFLREGFPVGLLAGCVVAFAGTAIIGVATSQHGVAAGWGAGLCIVAAFAYAAAVVVQKPVLGRVSAFQVTWIACTVATIACLPFVPCRRLVSAASRTHRVLRGGPERPGEGRREPLAAVLVVRQARHAVAPVATAESLQEQRALRIVEQQVVNLVGVFVLHDAPGELTCSQQIGVEPDLARY